MKFTEERENFLKLSYIIFEIAAKHLRKLFKKKWNEKYPNQQWNSDATSGEYLYSKVSKRLQNDKIYAEKIETGNEQEWDTTTLTKVMEDSSFGFVECYQPKKDKSSSLCPRGEMRIITDYKDKVSDYLPKASCPSEDFKQALSDIKSAANNLFDEDVKSEIGEIENGSITKEFLEKVREMMKMVTDLKPHDKEKFANLLNGKLSQLNFILFF